MSDPAPNQQHDASPRSDGATSIWDDVVGQESAVEHLRRAAVAPVHAYLLVGPPGSTKDEAARAFAAAVLAGGADEPTGRDARLALAGRHPDVREVERFGPAISVEQAREIVRVAALAPVEGRRKVLVLHEFHLVRPEGAAVLLKTIEEPPPSTTFVVLADFVPLDLVTIASRCVRVEFRPVPDALLADRLRADGFHDDERLAVIVAAAGGDLERARLLADDPALAGRRQTFADIPHRLDGSGSVAFALVDDVVGRIDDAAAALTARHAAEAAELEARVERLGERGSGRKPLEERQARETRRHRTGELRSGLAVLAGTYRDVLVAGGGAHTRPEELVAAVRRIHDAIEALERNPNEKLLLQSLLWSLPAVVRD